jgi:hypothetical protein
VSFLQGHADATCALFSGDVRPDRQHFNNSGKGVLSMFNVGSSEFVSEQGLLEAQRFYEGRRHGRK